LLILTTIIWCAKTKLITICRKAKSFSFSLSFFLKTITLPRFPAGKAGIFEKEKEREKEKEWGMNILLVHLEFIGDVLLSTPALRVLCGAYPDASIDVVVQPDAAPVLRHHPGVRRVITVDPYQCVFPWQFAAALREIRQSPYDLALCLQPRKLRPTLLAGLSSAARVCGYAHKLGALFFEQNRRYARELHKVDAYLRLLEEIGVPPAPHQGLEFWVDEASQVSAEVKWREVGLAGNPRVIGLNSGGRNPAKQWTAAGFAELHDRLRGDGYTPVFFGGPDDVEQVEGIRARCAKPGIALTGQLSLSELVALLRHCAALVTNDSGPMHIAASQHTPVVAIFGPTRPSWYGPYGTPHRIASAEVPCLGCWKGHCADARCMTELTAEQVHTELRELLVQQL
jgi:heptosyltransferase-2